MRKITLPLSDALQTSLMLVLYRWRDKHYENTEIKNSNDTGAVTAMIDILNEQTQEPECEHRWCYKDSLSDEEVCSKCGIKKPAKNECDYITKPNPEDFKLPPHLEGATIDIKGNVVKDSLAERLKNAPSNYFGSSISNPYELMADEARKWAVEQVEKAFYDTDEQYDGVLLDEVLARLKEAK